MCRRSELLLTVMTTNEEGKIKEDHPVPINSDNLVTLSIIALDSFEVV
jgi:hypothetical protein